jgi:hypothetical protein
VLTYWLHSANASYEAGINRQIQHEHTKTNLNKTKNVTEKIKAVLAAVPYHSNTFNYALAYKHAE